MPAPAAVAELKIEAVAIARVVRLSGHQRQYILADFRDPGIRGDCFATEFLLQEPVRMNFTYNADEFTKLG